MSISMSPQELYAAFVLVRESAGFTARRLAEDPPAAFLFDALDPLRQDGVRSLQERGLAGVGSEITVDPYLRAMLREIIVGEWQLDVRVAVCGDIFGMAVPYVAAYGFDDPDAIWTTVTTMSESSKELSTASLDGALTMVDEAVIAAYERADDDADLRVFVTRRWRGEATFLRVSPGQAVHGTVTGCGTSSTFEESGPPVRWDRSLLLNA